MFSVKKSGAFYCLILGASVSLVSCGPDSVDPPVNNAPTSYNFSNANYGGQTVRLLLLKDLEAEIEKAATQPVTKASLMAIFTNADNRYAEIATGKRLSDKVVDDATRTQIEDWFQQIEDLSAGANPTYVTADGQDLKELVEKTIMGSVFYYRALNDYLSITKLEDDDNATVNPGEGTEMEHHFDEAFGYFGASKHYNTFTDTEIATLNGKDINGDGTIDLVSESNYYFAKTAAKRDLAPGDFTNGTTDFTKTIFDAFVSGRHAVSTKSYANRNTAVTTIRQNWDKLIAATVIHYAQEVVEEKENQNPTPEDLLDTAKDWSEMKAYFAMIQYNTDNKLGQTEFNRINSLLGTNSQSVSVDNLESAISSLKATYNF